MAGYVFCCSRRSSISKSDTILIIGGPAPVFTFCVLNPSNTIWGTYEVPS